MARHLLLISLMVSVSASAGFATPAKLTGLDPAQDSAADNPTAKSPDATEDSTDPTGDSAPESTPEKRADTAEPAAEDKDPAPAAAQPPSAEAASSSEVPEPKAKVAAKSSTVNTFFSLNARFERQDALLTDRYGTVYEPEDITNMQARIGAKYRHTFRPFVWLDAQYEQDLYTGISNGKYEGDDFVGLPNSKGGEGQLRRAQLGLRLGYFAVGTGVNMSHWGLGLIANDGDHGWTPQNANFSDPRGGDRVLRSYLMVGPFLPAKLAISLAFDRVVEDDVLVGKDEAKQIVTAIMLNPRGERTIGIYSAIREQTHQDGGKTEAVAIDVYGKWTQNVSKRFQLVSELEVVTIAGKTDLGPNPDFAQHDVFQVGAASRTALNAKRWGAVVDMLFASGDDNLDDDTVSNFKADQNFHMGQIIFRHALAAMSARSPITAADPDLVGYPARDLDRIPTRGAVTSTFSIFPRVWWTPDDKFYVYGGPLFAFSSAKVTDPFNTKIEGGAPRNALNGAPGSYLGTELNFGARIVSRMGNSSLTFGTEFAHFTPGSAFNNESAQRLEPMSAARLLLGLSL